MPAGFGKQVPNGGHSDTLQLVANVGSQELGGVPQEDESDRVPPLERAVHGQMKGDGKPGRICRTANRHVQDVHTEDGTSGVTILVP